MKLIRRGWQYSVYDIGNGRVLKRYNTGFESYLEMLKEQLFNLWFPVTGFSNIYKESKVLASRSLQKITSCTVDQSLFGNPKIIGELEYEQDLVKPLSDYFENHSVNESKKMIDKFIKFCKLLHKNSLIEKHFNMADNFGLNNSEEIVLIDLGEICSSKEEISKQINKQVWLGPDVLGKFPAALGKYFIQKMNEAFGKNVFTQNDII